MRYAVQSLAEACYDAANKDPLLALDLALDIQKIAAVPRWPLNSQGPGPRAREAASRSSLDLTAPAQALPEVAPPGPLTDLEAAA